MILQIDAKSYKDKEGVKKDIALIKRRIQSSTPCSLSVEEFAKKIELGYSFSPSVLEGGLSACNWIEQQVFCVDIDNDIKEELILSIDAAISICEANNTLPALYYFTFSHSEEKPKFRLVFICNETIKEAQKRKIIMDCLTAMFPQCDTTCKNADRMFFGTNKEVKICDAEARFSFEDLLGTYSPPENSLKNIKETDENEYNELRKLKSEFDFLKYLRERNGELLYNNSKYAMFKNCELCRHHNDLVYYHETKTFYCFSSGCNRGGSIIDYLIISEKMSVGEAIRHFKYKLCGITCPSLNRNIKLSDKSYQAILTKLKPEKNYTFNDKGTAELFADLHQNRCRYNTSAMQWYCYSGKVWTKDPEGMQVSRYAKRMLDELFVYSASIQDEDLKSKYRKYLSNLGKFKWRGKCDKGCPR